MTTPTLSASGSVARRISDLVLIKSLIPSDNAFSSSGLGEVTVGKFGFGDS